MNPEDLDPEIVVVIAAAVAWARRRGLQRPVVTRVTPLPAAGPWVWVGRAEQMAARRQVQRRANSSR